MVVYDVPEEAKKWARNQGWMLLSDLSESYESVEEDSMIELISPAPKTTFRIDPNFDLASQQILVEARTDDLIQEVSFWVGRTINRYYR